MTNTVKTKITELKMGAKKTARMELSKETKLVVKAAVVLLVSLLVIVSLQAYKANLQYANNTLIEQNEYLQAEIDSLKSQIVEETKVTSIEKTATEKYGMVYPTSDNYIVIKEDKKVSNTDLASKIRRRAYN